MRKGIAALAAVLSAALVVCGCSGSKAGAPRSREGGQATHGMADDSFTRPAPAPSDAPPTDTGATEPGLMAANADRPRVATPPARESVDEYRPAWWVAQPLDEAGGVKVGGMGEATELLDARRLAVSDAGRALREHLGREPNGVETERYTAVRLPNGTYRAFVLMTGKE